MVSAEPNFCDREQSVESTRSFVFENPTESELTGFRRPVGKSLMADRCRVRYFYTGKMKINSKTKHTGLENQPTRTRHRIRYYLCAANGPDQKLIVL